jgi:hypothetical protein
MSIILNLRDGTLIIPKKYYESYLNINWFLSGLINFSESNENTYTLWEDKAAVLSLFDSIKFQKLTIHKDVSLDYLENLADMWCAPQWIIEDIKERNLEYNELKELKSNTSDINNHVFKCINCSSGYKIKENTNTSCKHHNNSFNYNSSNYNCCGREHNDEPCVIGFHYVNTYDYNLIYDKLNNTE